MGGGGGFPTPACLPPLTQTALKEGGCHKPPASTAAPQGEEEDEAVAGGGSAARCLRRRRRTFSNRGGGRVKGGGAVCARVRRWSNRRYLVPRGAPSASRPAPNRALSLSPPPPSHPRCVAPLPTSGAGSIRAASGRARDLRVGPGGGAAFSRAGSSRRLAP